MLKRNSSVSKFLGAFLAALICVSMLISCLKTENDRPQTEAVTFTDALGREVTVSKDVKRVAALIGSFADVWLLAGGTVCAAAEDAWDDFGLDLPDAVSIGGAHSPSLELILSADPDLVIASASTASNVELKDALEGAGITVAYFDVDNFEDYLSMLDICTDITGRKDLYEKNGLDVQKGIETVKNEIEFEQVALFTINDKDYAMLHPVSKIEGLDDDIVILFHMDEENDRLTAVEDQAILDEAYALYEELLEEAE